jgi:DNA polymerase-3 subunit delta'
VSLHPWNRGLWHDLTQDRVRLPHALLLLGPRGVGKREFALSLGQWLLCESPAPAGPCGECKSCDWFGQGSHPDFRLIEPQAETSEETGRKGGKAIAVGDVRQLSDFLGLVSHQGGWRVVVLHPAETMNPAAGNALLKTLEEPPANVLLILVSHQPRRLLPTILSRCHKLAFGLPTRDRAFEWLESVGRPEAADMLNEVGGAPLLALEGADLERLERRRRFLGVLLRPDAASLSGLAQEFQARVEESWGWLTRWLYDLIAVRATGQVRYFPDQGEALARLAARTREQALWQLQQELLYAGRWLRHPLNGQLLLESWLMGYLDTLEGNRGR